MRTNLRHAGYRRFASVASCFLAPSCCLALSLLQAGCGAIAPSAPQVGTTLEHYDPAYLNAEAVAALRAGDRGIALILQRRAARLQEGSQADAQAGMRTSSQAAVQVDRQVDTQVDTQVDAQAGMQAGGQTDPRAATQPGQRARSEARPQAPAAIRAGAGDGTAGIAIWPLP